MFNGSLLPYQPIAVDQMVRDKATLVAYDLGLGKTVLAIAAIERLMDEGQITEPGLVVCLSSLKYQWAEQISKFSDSTPLVIDGTPSQRKRQYETALDWQNTGVDYVILNYEQVVNDWGMIEQLPRGFVVLDEATAIKSFATKRSKRVKKLTAGSPVNFALTGTPMDNGRPEELFSIMEAVNPKVLGHYRSFDQRYIKRNGFGGVERYVNLDELHQRVRPHIVRKRQSDPDVAPHLPTVVHRPPVLVPMDKATRGLYERVVGDLLLDLEEARHLSGGSSRFDLDAHYGSGSQYSGGGEYAEIKGRIMAKFTVLRMICVDPNLVLASAEAFNPMTGTGSEYAASLVEDLRSNKTINQTNLQFPTQPPKLSYVRTYVSDFLNSTEANKIVIFTAYVEAATKLASLLPGSVVYSGKMSAKEKEAAKVKFQTDPNTRVLVSTDAGGYGVDLPQANMLVNVDMPLSAGAAIQRNGRIKRASSQWPSVIVQDFLSDDTVEVRQHAVLQQKSAVANAIVDGEIDSSDGGFDLTVDTLSQFLKGYRR